MSAPAASAAAPSGPRPAVTPPPREGEVDDPASVRRDSVRSARWTARASAKVLGDVDVAVGSVDGPMTVGGRLIADRFAIGADSEVLGEVTVREALTITGESRFGGPVRAGELRIHGRLQAGGPITVERNLLLVGRLETPGDVTVGGDLSFDGSLASPGSVRARSVEGRQRGRGEAGNLVAEVVRIRRPGGFGPSNGRFDILRIEAREVHLEGVRCEYLRAERVHLGPGCHVVRLDGNLIQKHRSSYVGPEAPFERPRGMFR